MKTHAVNLAFCSLCALVIGANAFAVQETSRSQTKVRIATSASRSGAFLWDKELQLWASTDRKPVPHNKQKMLLDQVMPWIKIVLADEFVPKAAGVKQMDVVLHPRLGDTYLLAYTIGEYEIRIVDTSESLCVTITHSSVPRSTLEGAFREWQHLLSTFMRESSRFDTPREVFIVQAEGAINITPIYSLNDMLALSSEAGHSVEFWWNHSQYKLSGHEFQVGIWKKIDGMHPADDSYGQTNRYQPLRN